MKKFLTVLPLLAAAALSNCSPTGEIACAQFACDSDCTAQKDANGCITSCECPQNGSSSSASGTGVSSSGTLASSAVVTSSSAASGSSQGTSTSGTNVSSSGADASSRGVGESSSTAPSSSNGLQVIRGMGGEYGSASGGDPGPVHLVPLKRAGLSTEDDDMAAFQSHAGGVRALSLGSVVPEFGELPASLVASEYSVGTAPPFGPMVTGMLNAPTGVTGTAGQLDVIAVTATPMGAAQPTQLALLTLAAKPVQTPPAAGPVGASNFVGGFPTAHVALVDERWLHTRDDVNGMVHAYDLTMAGPTQGSFAEDAARGFSVPMSGPGAMGVLNALTTQARTGGGELAVTYSDGFGSGGTGGGVFIFNPATMTTLHVRLPLSTVNGAVLDLPAIAWSADGSKLLVGWDAYMATDFTKVESQVLVFDVTSGSPASLVDAMPATSDVVDPAARIILTAMHPTGIFPLMGASDEIAVVTAPYGEMARLDVFKLGMAHGRLAGVELGVFPADIPSVDQAMAGSRLILVVGTSHGIQVYARAR